MNIHQQVMNSMKEMAETFNSSGVKLQLPPPSSIAVGTTYIGLDYGKSITAKIPFEARFANPLSMYQGGFLCAAFDEVFGPLTYMAAGRPAVALEMSTTFIRPFIASDEFIEVKAELVSKTRTILVLKAEATNSQGKLVAIARNHSVIASDDNLKKNAASK